MIEPESREDLEMRMDELAREYHETRDPKVKAEIERLSRRLAEWNITMH